MVLSGVEINLAELYDVPLGMARIKPQRLLCCVEAFGGSSRATQAVAKVHENVCIIGIEIKGAVKCCNGRFVLPAKKAVSCEA